MQVDLDGAIRIARLAADFHWTWSEGDLERFCNRAGWKVIDSWRLGTSFQTDLKVSIPKAHAQVDDGVVRVMADAGETVKWIGVWVADTADDDEDDAGTIASRAQLVRAFEQLRGRICSELGAPVDDETDNDPAGETDDSAPEVSWTSGNAVITLLLSDEVVVLQLTNPLYREWTKDSDDGGYED
ncbi:MAG: hypothetical protein JWN03_7828 [Nocardia sp.]|uniref:DUF6301 family protein n=1 Tax=Nocardia sp. TaxID=1821 RepID=UPI00262BD40C|nr:DUF6301 family protein [Nocardia sp.]MCU1647553.1 hypothetical protein [Nocardia sp.]